LHGASQLRQGIALHLNVADFFQRNIPVGFHGDRLIEFRSRLELEVKNVLTGDPVSRIAPVEDRSRPSIRRIDVVDAVSEGLLDGIGLLRRARAVLIPG
jgi:hypothetical protein